VSIGSTGDPRLDPCRVVQHLNRRPGQLQFGASQQNEHEAQSEGFELRPRHMVEDRPGINWAIVTSSSERAYRAR
jgi:hypothetical protein